MSGTLAEMPRAPPWRAEPPRHSNYNAHTNCDGLLSSHPTAPMLAAAGQMLACRAELHNAECARASYPTQAQCPHRMRPAHDHLPRAPMDIVLGDGALPGIRAVTDSVVAVKTAKREASSMLRHLPLVATRSANRQRHRVQQPMAAAWIVSRGRLSDCPNAPIDSAHAWKSACRWL